MITEDYVSFETAKLLKEKGFVLPSTDYRDWICCMYDNNGNITWGCYSPDWYVRATIQMAMKWLREEHDLHIDIFVTYKDGIPHYQWSVDNLKTQDTISETPCCNAYEEACEAAIRYCLKNLI